MALADTAVTETKIASSAISSDKLANGSVTGGKVASGTLTVTHLQDGSALAGIRDNDGAGSGLDADMLDGQQGSYYLNWSNITNIPVGFADGLDNTGITVEDDPEVGPISTNRVPRWNGSSLTSGTIYDSGSNVGIGSTSPEEKLHIMQKTSTFGSAILLDSTNGTDGRKFYVINRPIIETTLCSIPCRFTLEVCPNTIR
jgi:hypothetical protein